VTTRQSPLSKFEAFMQRIVEAPFARLFPSRLELPELLGRLERAMEDNLVLAGEGRQLAPIVYDIYISIKDHQQINQSFTLLKNDWQKHLIEFAKQPHRHYMLKANPILRLHADSKLRSGEVHIQTSFGADANEGGIMATQALSAEQLAQLRQLSTGQQLAGVTNPGSLAPSQLGSAPPATSASNSFIDTAIPQARLIISLPQAGRQVYQIEKPIINIGRQLSNDIIVEDKRVSRYHAQIKYQSNGQFVIFDLGSTNGITINGQPNQRLHILRTGDHFTIGNYDFYFERR
jgi:Protein of unknown function (DUF3662)/FHA domain